MSATLRDVDMGGREVQPPLPLGAIFALKYLNIYVPGHTTMKPQRWNIAVSSLPFLKCIAETWFFLFLLWLTWRSLPFVTLCRSQKKFTSFDVFWTFFLSQIILTYWKQEKQINLKYWIQFVWKLTNFNYFLYFIIEKNTCESYVKNFKAYINMLTASFEYGSITM